MPFAGRIRVVTFVCVAAVLNAVCGVHVFHESLRDNVAASTDRAPHCLPACVRATCPICAFLAHYAALQPEATVAAGRPARAREVVVPPLRPVLEPDSLGSGSPRAPPSQPA
jgi:hypothetical protein